MSKEYFHAAYGSIETLDSGGKILGKNGETINRVAVMAHFINHVFSTPDIEMQKKLEDHKNYKKLFWIKGEEPEAYRPKAKVKDTEEIIDTIQEKISRSDKMQEKIARGNKAAKELKNVEEKKDESKT